MKDAALFDSAMCFLYVNSFNIKPFSYISNCLVTTNNHFSDKYTIIVMYIMLVGKFTLLLIIHRTIAIT